MIISLKCYLSIIRAFKVQKQLLESENKRSLKFGFVSVSFNSLTIYRGFEF